MGKAATYFRVPLSGKLSSALENFTSVPAPTPIALNTFVATTYFRNSLSKLLSSALGYFTSEFGMESGGTNPV